MAENKPIMVKLGGHLQNKSAEKISNCLSVKLGGQKFMWTRWLFWHELFCFLNNPPPPFSPVGPSNWYQMNVHIQLKTFVIEDLKPSRNMTTCPRSSTFRRTDGPGPSLDLSKYASFQPLGPPSFDLTHCLILSK